MKKSEFQKMSTDARKAFLERAWADAAGMKGEAGARFRTLLNAVARMPK